MFALPAYKLPTMFAVLATRLPLNVFALITFAPVKLPPLIVMLPPEPVVLKLPAFTLPVKLALFPESSKLTFKLVVALILPGLVNEPSCANVQVLAIEPPVPV